MRWELERLLRSIIESLQALERAIRQQSETIHKEHESGRNARNDQPIQPLPVEIMQAPDLDPARREYYVAENRERGTFWRRLKPWVETIGVSVAVVLAGLTYLTLQEVRKQTPSVKKSADAAKSAAETAKNALQDSQRSFLLQNRPYVNVEIARLLYKPEGGKRLEASCLVRNYGQTPAIGLMPDISIEGRTSPLPKVVTRLGSKSKIDIGAHQAITVPVPGRGPIRPDSAAKIESGYLKIYVYGFLDYSDVFGCKYTTEFCGYYDPRIDSENPLMLLGCGDHNQRTEYKCEPK